MTREFACSQAVRGAVEAPLRRFGLIGCGRIARPVIESWTQGGLPGWTLSSVLARGRYAIGTVCSTDDVEQFFAAAHDVIVEAAGPQALAMHGVRALAVADVWTVSAAALADADLHRALDEAGRLAGHRLRVLPGAIAGLDGVAMASVDPEATLRLDIDLLPGPGLRALVFEGSVRQAAMRFPGSVNVAAAAALAGPGMDATRIAVQHPGPVPRHRLQLQSSSRYGTARVRMEPAVAPGVHPVAASIISGLRRECTTIWVG